MLNSLKIYQETDGIFRARFVYTQKFPEVYQETEETVIRKSIEE